MDNWLFKTRDMLSRGAGKVVFRSPWPVLQQAYNFNFWFARDPPGIGDTLQTRYRTCQATHLLLSQRKCGILPVGNQNGGAMKQTLL